MRRLLAAALLAAGLSTGLSTGLPTGLATGWAAAQGEPRWGPVAEELGVGSGVCLDGEDIVCAVVLCEEGALTLGVLGTGHGGPQPAFRGQIEVDGEAVERAMESRVVMQEFLHVRTPVEPGEPLWQRLRAGSRLSLTSSPDGTPPDYSLRGSAAELDRVAKACR